MRAEPKVKAKALTVPAEPKKDFDFRDVMHMLPELEEMSRRYSTKQQRTPENNPFKLPTYQPQVLAALNKRNLPTMAMDNALMDNLNFSGQGWLAGGEFDSLPGQGLAFMGFTFLSELAQRPEFRVMSETIADDATRKWIDFDVVGDEQKQREERAKDPQGYDERMADPDQAKKRVSDAGKLDKVKALKDDQLRLMVKDRFYDMSRGDGFFGRMHLFCDIRTAGSGTGADINDIKPEELKSPLGDSRDAVTKTKVPIGSFKGLRSIEPVWTYPLMYNAINPLREDWYNPQVWFVMGQEIHGTRLQTFIGHPVPDMLKPAYSFSGLSLTQMAKPYVDIWLQTRQSVAELIHSFSVMVLMTDLSTQMQPGNLGALLGRVSMFNMLRDNQGTFVVNKNTEDFKNVSASLSGLHELQAQSQEHMAAVHRIPLVKFTGIQPSGLNACLTADTVILTDRGQVPISDVTLSDRVMTRCGFAPLTFSGITKHATELIEIKTSDTVLKCTANHPIWLPSINAFVRAENVRHGDRLLLIGEKNAVPNMRRPWHGAGNGGGRTHWDTISVGMRSLSKRCTSIEEFGRRIEALFQMVFISITSTTISKTINSPILKRCMESFMPSFMGSTLAFEGGAEARLDLDVARIAQRRSSSKRRQAERSFAAATAHLQIDEQMRYQRQNPDRPVSASSVMLLSQRFARMLNFARVNAQLRAGLVPSTIAHTISHTLKNSFSTNETLDALRFAIPKKNASDAASSSFRPDGAMSYIALSNVRIEQDCHDSERVVSVRKIWASEPVYDLTIAPGHLPEFFANGILVHNSSEGEIETYDDTIMAYQSRVLDPNLRKIINFQQWSLFGELDPEITHRWEKLRDMTLAEKGQKEKDDADRNQKYVDMGAISPGEVRKAIIEDPELPYTGLDPDDVPEPPADEGLLGPGGGAAAKVDAEADRGLSDKNAGSGGDE